MPKKKTTVQRIIDLLDEKGPLGPANIAKELEKPSTTIKALLSLGTQFGVFQHYKGIRGVYELTEHGKTLVKRD